jgi:hypothetical protein
MPTDVLSVLREQLVEAEDLVRRLATAIAALAGAGLRGGRGRDRLRTPESGRQTGNRRKRTGHTVAGGQPKKRTFSAATRAKMAAAQKARWAKRKSAGK